MLRQFCEQVAALLRAAGLDATATHSSVIVRNYTYYCYRHRRTQIEIDNCGRFNQTTGAGLAAAAIIQDLPRRIDAQERQKKFAATRRAAQRIASGGPESAYGNTFTVEDGLSVTVRQRDDGPCMQVSFSTADWGLARLAVDALLILKRKGKLDDVLAFMRSMLENFDDNTTPLVYADFLDENGMHDRASRLREMVREEEQGS